MNNNIFNPQCVRVADRGTNKGSWDLYLNALEIVMPPS